VSVTRVLLESYDAVTPEPAEFELISATIWSADSAPFTAAL
jgi:hypothetical protein